MEIKLNDEQEKMKERLLENIISDKKFSLTLQKFYNGREILQYVEEGCKFYDPNMKKVSVMITNDDRLYCDFFNIDQEKVIVSVKTILIPSFKDKEEDFEYLIKGEKMVSSIVDQRMQMSKEQKIRLDKLVFIQHSKWRTQEETLTNLSIVFYIKERGKIDDRITITD